MYGTLRHDQPEHARVCRGVRGWRAARVRGTLFRIPAGYRLVVVPPESVLLRASRDANADEFRRDALAADAVAHAQRAALTAKAGWIEGELLTFDDAAAAWPALDAWEDAAPGEPGLYPRCVIPVEIVGEPARVVAAWAYVATAVLAGAVALGKSS